MFTTSQAQHLQGAASLQIENQITELVQKLNEADKVGKKEVYNYDFWSQLAGAAEWSMLGLHYLWMN